MQLSLTQLKELGEQKKERWLSDQQPATPP